MKTINFLLVLFVITLFSCCEPKDSSTNPPQQTHYLNETFTIVKIDEIRRAWLIQRDLNKEEFAELYVENDPNAESNMYFSYTIPVAQFYVRKVGETIKFDYIRKDRFFIIKQLINEEENEYIY